MSDSVLSRMTYLKVFAALLILTGLTVGAAFVDLAALNTVLALTIAVAKATLVLLYFMHARQGSHLTWVFIGAGVFWFLILVAFLMGDVWSRGWIPVSPGWE